jgi:hypothetical protein
MPSLPEVDAVVADGEDVYLVEAKLFKIWENIGKMLIYKTLLPQTPGWENVDVQKLKLVMVVGQVTPDQLQLAQAHNIQVDVFLTDRAREILLYGFPSQRKA